MRPLSKTLHSTTPLLVLGGLGAVAADAAHLPLPYLLGAMAAVALATGTGLVTLPDGYTFPPRLRLVFIGIIGLMIGARITPEVLEQARGLAVSMAAVLLYVPLAHGLSYMIFRRVGEYDPVTAYFAAAPGGLMESIAMGEEGGADPLILTAQQFLRIILVVTLVPVGLSLWLGHPVGSSAGLSLAPTDSDPRWLPVILALALAGSWLGMRLGLPAGQLTGPLILAAVLGATGLVPLEAPRWLVNLAQTVIGTSLGTRFHRLTPGLMWRVLRLSVLSVSATIALGLVFAIVLHRLTEAPVDALFVSFAPGGVIEMAIVALSLSANPAFVTFHHVLRILITVLGLGIGLKIVTSRSGSGLDKGA